MRMGNDGHAGPCGKYFELANTGTHPEVVRTTSTFHRITIASMQLSLSDTPCTATRGVSLWEHEWSGSPGSEDDDDPGDNSSDATNRNTMPHILC